MIARRRSNHARLVSLALPLVLCAAGCAPQDPAADRRAESTGRAPQPGAMTGTVTIGGSSTMLPISRLIAEAFEKRSPGVKVQIDSQGTGAGFKRFCTGQLDLAGASRPINEAESQECAANAVEFIELPVAFDSVSVVVNAKNTFAECLTVGELKKMWEPSAEGRVTRWNQVRSTFPNQPLTLFGPDAQSGTFDYFTLAVVGTESQSRRDYTKSDDGKALADGIAQNPHALGYFGYSNYVISKSSLKLVSIDGGTGCVAPSAEAVAENRYQPLARPLLMYVSASSAARPEVKALAHLYVSPESARLVTDTGDMPLPIVVLLTAGRRLDKGVTGSLFGGHGSVVGLTADALQDEDRLKSSLVR